MDAAISEFAWNMFRPCCIPVPTYDDVNEIQEKTKRKMKSMALLAVTIIFNNNTGMRLTGFGISSGDKGYSVFRPSFGVGFLQKLPLNISR